MSVTRIQIEEDLKNKGDFVKIDHLNRFLKQADSLDTRKFVLMKLAAIYEDKGFFIDAAKNIGSAAEIAITYKEKIDLYMKEAAFYVKLGSFELADKTFQKVMSLCTARERVDMQAKYVQFYYNEAQDHEKAIRNRRAADFYEKLSSMPYQTINRIELKQKLLELYNKLGRIRDYSRLSSRQEPQPETKPSIAPGSFEDLGIKRL